MAAPYKLVVCVFVQFVSYVLEGLTLSLNKSQTRLSNQLKMHFFCHNLLDLGAVQGSKKKGFNSFNSLIMDHFF